MNTQTDFSALLVPISPENPAGENLEYDVVFDEIRESRQSDSDIFASDEWSVSEPRKANWERVRFLSERTLGERSKDLQLACWLVESLYNLQGLTGLIDGMQFLHEFINRFWLQCWPSLVDEGGAIRRGRLVRLDRDISQLLFTHPVLTQANTSLAFWCQIQAFEHKISAHPDLRDELIAREGDWSMATFDRDAQLFSAADICQQAARVNTVSGVLSALDTQYVSLSQDPEGDVFVNTRRTLTDLAEYLQRLMLRVPGLTQREETLPSYEAVAGDESSVFASQSTNEVLNREKAVSQMLAIARYFRQTEPSSPVPFLMERAARWAEMTLTEWLEEMLTDNNSMREITNVLTGQTPP